MKKREGFFGEGFFFSTRKGGEKKTSHLTLKINKPLSLYFPDRELPLGKFRPQGAKLS